MSTRTVRLDDESERILAEIRRGRQLSVSDALKQGLVALRETLREEGPATIPSRIYETIDLGPGGYARTEARRAKADLSRILRREPKR